MLGAADIESWDEDVRAAALTSLRTAGWARADRGDAPTVRLRRLLRRFRAGETLATRELSELSRALRDR